jgi:putative transposase
VVWNQTLAARHARWQAERTATSYAETDAALTLMKKDPDLSFLSEVSSVPLQQALRHQHQAFTAFFARRACYPRFKSRHGRCGTASYGWPRRPARYGLLGPGPRWT